jgi:hypothetical protein
MEIPLNSFVDGAPRVYMESGKKYLLFGLRRGGTDTLL